MSDVAQRTLKVVSVMVGHEANGISVPEITDALSEKDYNIHRVIADLLDARWVEAHPRYAQKYRLAPIFATWANTITLNLKDAMHQLEQEQQHYSRLYQ